MYKEKEREFFMDQIKNLPINVQKAVIKALSKKKHTDFYYKLENISDRIKLFIDMFN